MLIDVLTRFAKDSGLHVVQQRDKLVDIMDKAAKELYQELDCNRIKREISCAVGNNKIVALPPYVGDLRGMRQHSSQMLVPLEPMSPRYVTDTLGYQWNNWRDVGISPVHTTPVSVDVLTFASNVVEDTVVTISGQTSLAARESEDLTLDSTPKDSVKLWNPAGLKSISTQSVRNGDITVKDADGNEVAVLYNTQRQTSYRIVDVSLLFFGNTICDDETLVDILYKIPLEQLTLDTDEFPAGSIYDEAWYARSMALFLQPMEGQINESNRYRALSIVLASNIKDGSERGEVKQVEWARNKFYDATYPDYWKTYGYTGWR